MERRKWEGRDEKKREGANVQIVLRMLPVVAHKTSVGERLCATA